MLRSAQWIARPADDSTGCPPHHGGVRSGMPATGELVA